MVKSQRKYSLS